MSYVINGGWRLDWAGEYQLDDVNVLYDRSNDSVEEFVSLRQTPVDLNVLLMPTNALANLQFDFFLLESRSEDLWMAPEARVFSVDATDAALSPRSEDPEPTFDVDRSEMDSWQATTTDDERYYTKDGTDQSERTSASRDEHLPLRSPTESYSLSSDDHWSDDNFDLQVDQPPDVQHADYRDDIITRTRVNTDSHRQRLTGGHRLSTRSETEVITNKRWTWSSSSTSTSRTTEASTSLSDGGRSRQIHPPLTMHFADYMRQISRMSEQITTSTPLPSTTTTSQGRRTGGRSRSGVTSPSSSGSRRTWTRSGSSECGRRCPRFRPGVRRQFCHAQFVALVNVTDYQYINNTTRYDVRVIELLRQVSTSLADREFIWVDNVCRCPRLDIGSGYVVMGRLAAAGAESRETRLQITDRSVAMPVDTWQQRFASRNFNCRRRHHH